MNALTRILERMPSARRVGSRWEAPCPAHRGTGRNLRISQGREGVLLRCWSHDCSAKEIAHALGLEEKDLFDRPLEPQHHRRIEYRSRPVSVGEIEGAVRAEAQREIGLDAERLGYASPLTSRHVNRAKKSVAERYAVSLKPVRALWWETYPHAEDPLWPILAHRALQEILWERDRSEATLVDRLDAEERAAAWMRTEARRVPEVIRNAGAAERVPSVGRASA